MAGGIADLKAFGIERTRRAHLSGSIRAHGNEHGGKTAHFDFTLYRNDRAVADLRSAAGEQHRIGARLFINLISNLRSKLIIHALELHAVAHKTDMLAGNAADKTGF